MALNLTWTRTTIAGELPATRWAHNCTASDGERGIGRVYRHNSGGWYWAMSAWGPDIR